jgi:predicted nucleic acid-binding protein
MSLSFIDTNIVVYAYDADAGIKHTRAQTVLQDCWETESGVVSTQVIQEFYVTVTRKLAKPLSAPKARDVIAAYRPWPVYQPTIEDILAASALERQHRLSFWDALIVTAAQMSGATSLITEDLQDGRQIGSVKIINPFRRPA